MDRIIQHIRRRSLTHRPKRSSPRRLYVTSSTPTFDSSALRRFEAEGFEVEYLPFATESDDVERDRKELETLIHEREDDLEPEERYAIVACNRPAYLLLLSHHQQTNTNPFPLLCAFIAMYPCPPQVASFAAPSGSPHLPPSTTAASTSTPSAFEAGPTLPIQIHLAKSQNQNLVRWDDSNKRHRCHIFFYPESERGFAEFTSSPAYDRISSRLAWSRALDCLKRGFGWPSGGGNWGTAEPEIVWEAYWKKIYDSVTLSRYSGASSDILGMMIGGGAGDPDFDDRTCVNCVPSAAGGSSPSEIADFYSSQFIPAGPPTQHIRLLSRTTGPDRVIDELLLTFEHTEEIPWLLPGVPPTGRSVRIPLIMAVSFCAGKIARHNIYWDQASVLVQIGLLDPALIPSGFSITGPNRAGKATVERLPVVGGEAVDSVLN